MIQLENVCFSRQDGEHMVPIINQLSLQLESAQQLALLGDSGSGKTTLLNLLAGLLGPDSGKIIINDQNISQYDEKQLALYRRKIGLVFQHYQLLDCLNVKHNMLFQHQLNQYPHNETAFMDLVTELGIENKLNALPHQLSGGEQQRVGIARALMNQPKLLLADEPTGNLDQTRSHGVVELITQLCKARNINLIMVTHSQQLTHYFDQVKVLKNGRLDD